MSKTSNNQKPELILKRVNDLIHSAVGSNADKEKRIALDQLHTVICVKRKNVWTKSYEALMKRHLELCVDLKDHLTAKDGLHQYRNLCITVDPNSLEIVILHLMDLSEERAAIARQKANKVSLAAANRVADLDQEESPESIMLSSMTEEGVKERTDREVVIPWLRFLWENYRAILELLYRLPKLEKVYHRICEKAFRFCEEYSRNMEFRRLCDMLRQQLNNLQKNASSAIQNATRFPKAQGEWTSESTEYHLQTRFAQLEVATKFELWNEAFRTIEDINGIIAFSKKTPKSKLMVTYYEKLTRIFAVADNKLFHAYSCFKLYQWTLDARKDIRSEEKALMASVVVLAALAVPNINDTFTNVAVDEDDTANEKSSQLATLLDFQANPSRQLLLYEIANLGLIDEVLPELKNLYEIFEVKFLPLKFIPSILPALNTIRSTPGLKHYAEQLEKIAVIRVVQQLSKVYNTVKLEFLYKLFTGLQCFSLVQIEKLLLEAVANKQLSLKISHGQGIVTFKTASSSSVALDTQVAKLGTALNKVARVIDSVTSEGGVQQKALNRRVYISAIAENEESEFVAYADRKVLIERRKEELERIQQEKAKEERRQKDLQEHKRLQDEKDRQEEEERKRNEEKLRKVHEKREVARIQAELEKFNITKTEAELFELEYDQRIQLVVDAQNEALKKKEEEKKKLQNTAKQLDYSARAQRIDSAPRVEERQQKEADEDEELLKHRLEILKTDWQVKHVKDLEEKKRLEHVQAHRAHYEQIFLQRQRDDYDRHMNALRKRLIAEKREQRLTAARKQAYEEAKRLDEERIAEEQRIEAERLEIERFEKLRRQREEDEERERQREAEKQRLEEERQRKAAEDKKRQEEDAAARAAANKGRVDPFGRTGEERSAPVERRPEPFENPRLAALRGDRPPEKPSPFVSARPREESRRDESRRDEPREDLRRDESRREDTRRSGGGDPFDNFKRGQKLPEPEPPRRGAGGGGYDGFKRGEKLADSRSSDQGDNEDKAAATRPAVATPATPATGSAGKYVPPSARAGGRFDESSSRPQGTGDRFAERKESGRGFSERERDSGKIGYGDRDSGRGGFDRDRDRDSAGRGGSTDRDRRQPERKPDNRSGEATSWRGRGSTGGDAEK